MGSLFVVGTPIGNLGDMTYRAVETLEKVDFICAEDTRVSAKLLNYFEIKTPLVSYHEHNAAQVGSGICDRIAAGENAEEGEDAEVSAVAVRLTLHEEQERSDDDDGAGCDPQNPEGLLSV